MELNFYDVRLLLSLVWREMSYASLELSHRNSATRYELEENLERLSSCEMYLESLLNRMIADSI